MQSAARPRVGPRKPLIAIPRAPCRGASRAYQRLPPAAGRQPGCAVIQRSRRWDNASSNSWGPIFCGRCAEHRSGGKTSTPTRRHRAAGMIAGWLQRGGKQRNESTHRVDFLSLGVGCCCRTVSALRVCSSRRPWLSPIWLWPQRPWQPDRQQTSFAWAFPSSPPVWAPLPARSFSPSSLQRQIECWRLPAG